MIVFGCPIRDEDKWGRLAQPTIEALREPDSVVIAKRGYDSIQEPYNAILDEAMALEGLEAVVLMHEDTVVVSKNLLEVVRGHLRDPEIGVVGAVGATGVSRAEWWSGSMRGMGLENPPVGDTRHDYTFGAHYVDVVDGFLMVVSASAAAVVRFDERAKEAFHCYDADFCFRARAIGFRIVVDDIETQHHSLAGDPSDGRWGRAAAHWRRTWDPDRWPDEWRGSAPYGFFR